MTNVLDISDIKDFSEEVFETLHQNDKVRIERIVSSGQITSEGDWQESEQGEWVVLLQGESELIFQDGEVLKVAKGDCFYISAYRKHRVTYTSIDPKCIWIAVHF